MGDDQSLGNKHVDARSDEPNGAQQTEHCHVARPTQAKNLEQNFKRHDCAGILEEHASVVAEEDKTRDAEQAPDREDA